MSRVIATPENMAREARNEGEPISARGIFSHCDNCGARYSASAGDYFMQDSAEALECCGEPMILAREVSNVVAIV